VLDVARAELAGDPPARVELVSLAERPDLETAVSYPIILRSYEPVADLDERLRRIFAVLSLHPLWE